MYGLFTGRDLSAAQTILRTGVLSGLAEALGGASETSEPGSPRVALGPTPTR